MVRHVGALSAWTAWLPLFPAPGGVLFSLAMVLLYYMFPYKSIDRTTKYVPIYLLLFYMDTYRQECYNKDTMERMHLILGHSQEVSNMSVSEAQKKASIKYLEKLDEIRIRMPKGEKKNIKEAASAAGESMNQYIINAVDQRMEREKEGGEQNE